MVAEHLALSYLRMRWSLCCRIVRPVFAEWAFKSLFVFHKVILRRVGPLHLVFIYADLRVLIVLDVLINAEVERFLLKFFNALSLLVCVIINWGHINRFAFRIGCFTIDRIRLPKRWLLWFSHADLADNDLVSDAMWELLVSILFIITGYVLV